MDVVTDRVVSHPEEGIEYKVKQDSLFLSKRNGERFALKEICFVHNGNRIATMNDESEGTLKIIHLLNLLISQDLGKEDTIVVDEFECSIHTSIMMEIVKLFTQAESKGTQFIATTHETRIMDAKLIKTDSIWFVDSDDDGADHKSELYSLKSFEGRIYGRGDMYIEGRFGAIPSFLEYDLGE